MNDAVQIPDAVTKYHELKSRIKARQNAVEAVGYEFDLNQGIAKSIFTLWEWKRIRDDEAIRLLDAELEKFPEPLPF